MDNQNLISKAKSIADEKILNHSTSAGRVACALITNKGNVYVGKNIDVPCGLGTCAEHAAVSAMLTGDESVIKKIVAVNSDGKILPPCGRCRELIFQISKDNLDTIFILENNREATLRELLPERWLEEYLNK